MAIAAKIAIAFLSYYVYRLENQFSKWERFAENKKENNERIQKRERRSAPQYLSQPKAFSSDDHFGTSFFTDNKRIISYQNTTMIPIRLSIGCPKTALPVMREESFVSSPFCLLQVERSFNENLHAIVGLFFELKITEESMAPLPYANSTSTNVFLTILSTILDKCSVSELYQISTSSRFYDQRKNTDCTEALQKSFIKVVNVMTILQNDEYDLADILIHNFLVLEVWQQIEFTSKLLSGADNMTNSNVLFFDEFHKQKGEKFLSFCTVGKLHDLAAKKDYMSLLKDVAKSETIEDLLPVDSEFNDRNRRSIGDLFYSIPYLGSYFNHKESQTLEKEVHDAINAFMRSENRIHHGFDLISKNFEEVKAFSKREHALEVEQMSTYLLKQLRIRFERLKKFFRCIEADMNGCLDADSDISSIMLQLCESSNPAAPNQDHPSMCPNIIRFGFMKFSKTTLEFSINDGKIEIIVNSILTIPFGLRMYNKIFVENNGRISESSNIASEKRYEHLVFDDITGVFIDEYGKHRIISFPAEECVRGSFGNFLCSEESERDGFSTKSSIPVHSAPYEKYKVHEQTEKSCVEVGSKRTIHDEELKENFSSKDGIICFPKTSRDRFIQVDEKLILVRKKKAVSFTMIVELPDYELEQYRDMANYESEIISHLSLYNMSSMDFDEMTMILNTTAIGSTSQAISSIFEKGLKIVPFAVKYRMIKVLIIVTFIFFSIAVLLIFLYLKIGKYFL